MRKKSLKILICLLSLVVSTLTSCVSSFDNPYSYRRMDLVINNSNDDMFSKAYANDFIIPSYTSNILQDNINALSYFVGSIERNKSNYTKYKDPYMQLPIASLTKLMTFLVTIKNCDDLNKEFTVSKEALDIDKNSSVAGYKEGDIVKVIDLLYGLMVPSGNDAANVLAENLVDGGYQNFYLLMNNEAERLGCKNTHFANATGLDSDYHYSCCYDMYLIMAELNKYDLFKQICLTKEYTSTIRDEYGATRNVSFKATNMFLTNEVLMSNNVNMLAAKTGTTTNAGYCLIILAEDKRSKIKYISVVLNASNKRSSYNNNNALLGGIK